MSRLILQLLGTFILLASTILPSIVHAQCTADFEYTNQGLSYQFEDISVIAEGDSIISWSWDFGDGNTSDIQNPQHAFTFPDNYDVTLSLETNDGCTNISTQTIINCNLILNVVPGNICLDGEQEYLVQITDIYGVVDSVDISLDNNPISPTRHAINRNLNLNLLVVADGGIHNLTVTSDYSVECTEQFFLFPLNCDDQCKFTNLSVRANSKDTIEVRDTVFFPKNRVISLGDTILWKWVAPANSSTSDSISGPNMWDSDVKFLNDSFKVVIPNISVNPYYSKTRGGPDGEGMAGTIIVNCPQGMKKEIELIVEHENFNSLGFQVAIDGIILLDSIFTYDISGVSTAKVNLAADGLDHLITVIDVNNPNCTIGSTALIPDCGGEQPCQLNAIGYANNRCENDSILITLDINSNATSTLGLGVLYNGAITIDTIYPDTSGYATATYNLPYTSTDQRFTLRDLTNPLCSTEVLVGTSNCSAVCGLSSMEITKNQPSVLNHYIDNTGLGYDDINVATGTSIAFNWETNLNYGIRSTEGTWDSGIRQNGSLYLAPSIETASDSYEIYNTRDEIISSGEINGWDACEEGFVPIFISFIDDNGSASGYTVTVDDIAIPINFHYANGPINQLGIQILGDSVDHSIMITDNEDDLCQITGSIMADACTEFECMLEISATELDTCFNDDTRIVSLEIYNPLPFPRGFGLVRNGQQVSDEEINYDLDSFTNILDTVLADGTLYNYIVNDIFNETCSDTVEFQPAVCVTECSITNFSLRVVDEDFKAEFPNTPDVFVGCQTDSTSYVAVSFDEKYSDDNQYAIFIDNELFTTVTYNEGDGSNLAFVPIFGDSAVHSIRVADIVDSDCVATGNITAPSCFTECKVFVDDYTVAGCDTDSFNLSIYLDGQTNIGSVNIIESGVNLNYDQSNDTINIKLRGDGEQRLLSMIEIDNPLCVSPIEFTSPYCLECELTYSLTKLDSCLTGDLITYAIDISNNEETSLILSVNGVEQIIDNQSITEFDIQSDGSSSTIELRSRVDRFCFETINIDTEDCLPVLCDVDFSIETDGLSAVFTDNSITTEEIISQSWSIAGGISVDDVNTFTWNFIAVGVYTVCHGIVTDSCTNTICKDVNIDPCGNLSSLFEFSIDGGGAYNFVDLSSGQVDSYHYDFGDSNTSDEQNPSHTYAASGAYTVCLTVSNEEFECSNESCQDIDFVSAIKDPVEDAELKIYPNPAGEGDRIVIESSIPIKGYAIYSTDGRLIQAADIFIGMDKMSIRLQEKTADGLLLLNIKTDKGVFVRKIVSSR